jgi:hypothetical protein
MSMEPEYESLTTASSRAPSVTVFSGHSTVQAILTFEVDSFGHADDANFSRSRSCLMRPGLYGSSVVESIFQVIGSPGSSVINCCQYSQNSGSFGIVILLQLGSKLKSLPSKLFVPVSFSEILNSDAAWTTASGALEVDDFDRSDCMK